MAINYVNRLALLLGRFGTLGASHLFTNILIHILACLHLLYLTLLTPFCFADFFISAKFFRNLKYCINKSKLPILFLLENLPYNHILLLKKKYEYMASRPLLSQWCRYFPDGNPQCPPVCTSPGVIWSTFCSTLVCRPLHPRLCRSPPPQSHTSPEVIWSTWCSTLVHKHPHSHPCRSPPPLSHTPHFFLFRRLLHLCKILQEPEILHK